MAVRKGKKSGKWLVDVWTGTRRIRRLLPDKRMLRVDAIEPPHLSTEEANRL